MAGNRRKPTVPGGEHTNSNLGIEPGAFSSNRCAAVQKLKLIHFLKLHILKRMCDFSQHLLTNQHGQFSSLELQVKFHAALFSCKRVYGETFFFFFFLVHEERRPERVFYSRTNGHKHCETLLPQKTQLPEWGLTGVFIFILTCNNSYRCKYLALVE